MVNKTFLPPSQDRFRALKPLIKSPFSELARLSLTSQGTAAWESLAVRLIRKTEPGRVLLADRKQGENHDGECASRRTFAADGVGAADGCHRQQRRERQHQRFQGRPVDV